MSRPLIQVPVLAKKKKRKKFDTTSCTLHPLVEGTLKPGHKFNG
jgi:hypothetical protein